MMSIEFLIISGTSLLTFLMRYIPLIIIHGRKLPWFVEKLFYYLPLSIIGSLTSQGIFLEDHLQLSLFNPYLIGAIACILIGSRTKNLSIIVFGGMAVVAIVLSITELISI